jgi:hypothetical protein
MSIVPGALSFHLPFSVHLPTLIIQHNSLVHKFLETCIIITLQLQTEVLINSLKEETLLICIFPHFIGSLEILADTHLSHSEVFEFLLFQLDYTLRNMASLEISNKFIPSDRRSIETILHSAKGMPQIRHVIDEQVHAITQISVE